MDDGVWYYVSGTLRLSRDRRKNIDVPFYVGAKNALEARARYRGSDYKCLRKKTNPTIVQQVTLEEIPSLEKKIVDEGLSLNKAKIKGYVPKEYRWYIH